MMAEDDPFAARLAEMDKAAPEDDPFAARMAEMDAAAKGATEMGPAARGLRDTSQMRPSVKSDQELGLDEGPKFSREFPQFQRGGKTIVGVDGTIVPDAKSAPGTNAYRGAHAGDEMNDPLAQAITGAAIAAPFAAAAPAAIAPGVSGGMQAMAQGQDPVTGFALGMIPNAPGLARKGVAAADRAVGNKAVDLATSPTFGPRLQKAAKIIGGVGGGAKGLAMGGPVGGYVGVKAGTHAASAAATGIEKGIAVAARRRLIQQAREDLAQAAELPTAGAELSDRAARRMAASIDTGSRHIETAARPAPRATGFSANSPPIPERIAMPRAELAPPPRAAPVPSARAAAQPPRRLQILDENGRDLTAHPQQPTLLTDVRRDVQALRGQPYETGPSPKGGATPETAATARPDLVFDQPAAAPPDVGGQLAQSVQVLDLMKQAQAAGTLTPAMIRSAVKLGLPAQAVLKTVGKDAFTAAMKPAASLTPSDLNL